MIYQQYQEVIYDSKTILLWTFDDFVDENKEAKVKYYQDGLHLNEEGYKCLTQILTPVIEKYL